METNKTTTLLRVIHGDAKICGLDDMANGNLNCHRELHDAKWFMVPVLEKPISVAHVKQVLAGMDRVLGVMHEQIINIDITSPEITGAHTFYEDARTCRKWLYHCINNASGVLPDLWEHEHQFHVVYRSRVFGYAVLPDNGISVALCGNSRSPTNVIPIRKKGQ